MQKNRAPRRCSKEHVDTDALAPQSPVSSLDGRQHHRQRQHRRRRQRQHQRQHQRQRQQKRQHQRQRQRQRQHQSRRQSQHQSQHQRQRQRRAIVLSTIFNSRASAIFSFCAGTSTCDALRSSISASASASINITASASAVSLSSASAPAHPPATQCNLRFSAMASARMSVSASQKSQRCGPIVRAVTQVPASHRCDAIVCDTKREFLLYVLFQLYYWLCIRAATAAAAMYQQQQRICSYVSNNSSRQI
jgi:hypothetical protein